VLVLPALLINLGLFPFIDDEAIRALVSLEMKLSGNFITSTLGGEIYLKKPPLYNWIIFSFFRLFNAESEFVMRLPAILSLLLYAYLIFYFFKKEFGTDFAVINAFTWITCGRVIIYESQKGLIDILFSAIVFTLFMIVYVLMKRKQYNQLFFATYLLTFLGFLLKGMPSFVFLGITLLAAFIYFRQWRKLFSWGHVLSFLLLALLIATYYLIYFHFNPIPASEVFGTLIGESTRRTAIRFGFIRTVIHLFTFPVEVVYHFLPYTLLFPLLFIKSIRTKIWEHPFLKYGIIIVIANILIYWASPEVFARYLLMYVPIIYAVLIFAFLELKNPKIKHIIEMVLLGFMILVFVVLVLFPLFISIPTVNLFYLKWAVIPLLLGLMIWAYIKLKEKRLIIFIISLLAIRISFNWFVLTYRAEKQDLLTAKKDYQMVINLTEKQTLYTYWPRDIAPDTYYGKRIINFPAMFYITEGRQIALKSSADFLKGRLFLARAREVIRAKGVQYHILYQFNNDNSLIWLIKVD
jgi:4-amino-4-deoxy-L-arabinose transferase-like glycosyltransferase